LSNGPEKINFGNRKHRSEVDGLRYDKKIGQEKENSQTTQSLKYSRNENVTFWSCSKYCKKTIEKTEIFYNVGTCTRRSA
jgi:hypothetical protein